MVLLLRHHFFSLAKSVIIMKGKDLDCPYYGGKEKELISVYAKG